MLSYAIPPLRRSDALKDRAYLLVPRLLTQSLRQRSMTLAHQGICPPSATDSAICNPFLLGQSQQLIIANSMQLQLAATRSTSQMDIQPPQSRLKTLCTPQTLVLQSYLSAKSLMQGIKSYLKAEPARSRTPKARSLAGSPRVQMGSIG